MTKENKNKNSQQKCFFCGNDITRDEKLRTISDNNYLRLGVAAVDLENSKGSTICSKCWLSRMVQNRTTKKCAIASCTTSRRGLQSQRLCSLPLKNVDCQLRQQVLDRFNVNAEEKACRKCRSRITAFIKEAEGCKMPIPPAWATPKVSARIVLQNTVGQCNEISQRDGWDLLQDVTANTPIKKCANQGKKYQQKISEVMDGLSQTYEKEAHGATGKIRLLRRLPTVQAIFGHLGNTSALINMSYFFQLDMKI